MTSSPETERAEMPAAMAVPAWAWALVVYGLAVLYLVLQDNGLAFVLSADNVHDFFHDARHSLGVPCH
jgi:cobalt transporter subunit CbtB